MASFQDSKVELRPCFHYARGNCAFGIKCKYAHVVPLGNVNRLVHATPAPMNTPVEQVTTLARMEPFKGSSKNDIKNKKEKKEEKKGKGKFELSPKMKGVVQNLAKQAHALLTERKMLQKASDDFDKQWVSVDVKVGGSNPVSSNPYKDKIQINDTALKSLRAMARSTFGFRPVTLDVFQTFYFNTSAGGLAASALAIDPSTITEFISMASLFDQFKVTGGHYDYGLMALTQNTGTNINSYGVIAYDPTDNTVLPSLVAGSQMQQHQLVFKTIYATTIGDIFFNTTRHKFVWSVPPGVVTEAANPVASGTSNWQPTVTPAAPQPYGYIKTYFDNMLPVSSSCVSGQMTIFVDFRCRE